jgi:hypothetical protein
MHATALPLLMSALTFWLSKAAILVSARSRRTRHFGGGLTSE